MSPFSWNSRSKNETNSLFPPQLFPASFSRFPAWHCFPSNCEAMKLLKNSNTAHGLFIKKTSIEKKRSCKFGQRKFQRGEEGKGMAMGRVRFLLEMLTSWTGAGVKLPWVHTRTHGVRSYGSRCLCGALLEIRTILISF